MTQRALQTKMHLNTYTCVFVCASAGEWHLHIAIFYSGAKLKRPLCAVCVCVCAFLCLTDSGGLYGAAVAEWNLFLHLVASILSPICVRACVSNWSGSSYITMSLLADNKPCPWRKRVTTGGNAAEHKTTRANTFKMYPNISSPPSPRWISLNAIQRKKKFSNCVLAYVCVCVSLCGS